jgi:hypothetical protein
MTFGKYTKQIDIKQLTAEKLMDQRYQKRNKIQVQRLTCVVLLTCKQR